MIMKSTGEKINEILNDIGYLETKIQDQENENIPTQKVIDILLNVDKEKKSEYKITKKDNKDPYYLDMAEIEKWRDNNNNINQISGEIVITSHRKILGKIIVFSKKTIRKLLRWFIAPLIEEQNRVNGSLTASINALTNNDIVIKQYIEDTQNEKLNNNIIEEINIIKQEIEKLRINIEENKAENNEKDTIKNKEIGTLLSQIEEIKIKNESTRTLQEKVDKFNLDIAYLSQDIDMMKFWKYKENQDSEANKVKKNNNEEKNIIKVKQEALAKLDYHAFENKFRGTREEMKKRQKIYLKYFEGSKNVLDIGCGRGEFLELLSDNNVPSMGIDVYNEFVQYCRYKGLKATKEDAISYLSQQENNKIEGIFMSQVAEHLDTDYLIDLVNISYKKLQKGKYFIAETPNPKTLSIFSNAFYMDPSHKNPVHPETFKFIMEQAGFKDVKLLFTESSRIDYRLPLIESEQIQNQKEFNDGINLLSEMFFGSQDYAIIARK